MNFEDRLLVELRHEVASRPVRGTPRRARLVAVSATAVAAIGAVVVVALGGGSAAYAVESESNGTVTVQIRDLSDATGLQSQLRKAGIPALVRYGAGTPGCGLGAGVGGRSAAVPAEADGTGTPPKETRQPESGASPAGGGEPGMSPSRDGDGAGPSFNTEGTPPSGAGNVTSSSVEVENLDQDGVRFTIDPGKLTAKDQVYITTQTGDIQSIGIAICSK